MKNLIAPLLLLLLLLSSCKKKEEITQPAVDNNYSITTYQKVLAKIYSVRKFELSVNHTSFSNPNKVSISIEGLPDGVSASISKNNELPPFDAVISLTVKYVKPGSYPFKLIGKTEGHLPKEADVVLVVDSSSEANCVFRFGTDYGKTVGTYNEAGEHISDYPDITFGPSYPSNLFFLYVVLSRSTNNKNYYTDGRNLTSFALDCNNATISLAERKVAGTYLHSPVLTHSIKGAGTIDFANNTFTLPYESTDLSTGTTQKFVIRGTINFEFE
ncbi:MAG: hypothetical protein R2800_05265 [Flavipsychrobacter sp.]